MSEQPTLVSGITPGLTIRAEDYGDNPIADWLCACGHHERTTTARGVQLLAARVRVGHCPHGPKGAAA
ncbi:hypothetical protein [Streptomyces sp. KR55]|uniref:hypothetical protein n=1 Tax=Streptomyces sp. KR55 TaxID=3457425 RepID=UPI003FD3D6A0